MLNVYSTDYLNESIYDRGYPVDRSVDTDLQLPNEWYDIKIKPNDLVTYKSINSTLSKLNDNMLYIISMSKIASNKIPVRDNYSRYISTESANPDATQTTWYNNTQLPTLSATHASSYLSTPTNGHFFNNTNVDEFTGLINTSTTITTITGSHTNDECAAISSSSLIDNFTDRTFVDIKSTETFENSLYILDSHYKTVYKYDISGLRSKDPSYFTSSSNIFGKLLQNTLGGPGDTDSTFNTPNTIRCDTAGYLYVCDGAKIKRFDKNLNWCQTHDINISNDDEVVSILFYDSLLYILTRLGNIIKYQKKQITNINVEFEEISNHKLTLVPTDTLNTTEHYISLSKSFENENIVYVLTNKNVYKQFLTKVTSSIGKFTYENRGLHVSSNNSYSFLSIVPGANSTDAVFLNDLISGVIYNFNEVSLYESNLFDDYQEQLIPFSDITISPEEYVTNMTYNKALGKLIYGHVYIVNNVKSKFTSEFDYRGIKQYVGSRFLLPQEIDVWLKVNHPFFPELGNYIGVNEIVLTETINRTLKNIYELQVSLIEAFQVEMLNNRPVVQLNNSPDITPIVLIDRCIENQTQTKLLQEMYDDQSSGSNVDNTTTVVVEGAYAANQSAAQEIIDQRAVLEASLTTRGEYNYSNSYTLSWTGPLSAHPDSFQSLGMPTLTGDNLESYIESITGVYTNFNHADEWDGPLYNDQPFFTNTSSPLTATMWFTGEGWVISPIDSPELKATLYQRITSAKTPTGNYYWSAISENNVAIVT